MDVIVYLVSMEILLLLVDDQSGYKVISAWVRAADGGSWLMCASCWRRSSGEEHWEVLCSAASSLSPEAIH